MNSKKALVLFSTALLACSIAFAGGGKEAQSTFTMEDTKKQPSGELIVTPQLIGYENAEIELTWQPCPPHSMVSTQPARVEDIYAKATAWVKDHPNVRIVPVGTSSSVNDNMTKLRVTVAEGGAPDLSAVDSFMMPLFKEYAQPIGDVANAAGIYAEDFFPYIRNTVMDGDKMLALWYTTDVRGLYYRKDLIATPPTNVDELISVAKDMTNQGLTGLIYCGGRDEATVNNLWGLYWSQGAKLVNEDGSMAFDKGADKEAMLKFLTFFKRTIDEGVTPKTVIDYKNEPAMYGDVKAGKVAMFIGGNWAINQLRDLLGADEFNSKWGFAALPTMEKGQQSTSSAGGWTNVVFAKDDLKRTLAAELAIALYSSDVAQESWTRIGGYLPTRMSQYKSFDYLAQDPYSAICLDLLDNASTRPAVELYNVISTETQVAIGQVITGSATPEKALESLIQNVKNY
jgi:multiple sugar transport system substrate-binding protein